MHSHIILIMFKFAILLFFSRYFSSGLEIVVQINNFYLNKDDTSVGNLYFKLEMSSKSRNLLFYQNSQKKRFRINVLLPIDQRPYKLCYYSGYNIPYGIT